MKDEKWIETRIELRRRGYDGVVGLWKTTNGIMIRVSNWAGLMNSFTEVEVSGAGTLAFHHINGLETEKMSVAEAADDIERVAAILVDRVGPLRFAISNRNVAPFAAPPKDEHRIRLFGDPPERGMMRTLDVQFVSCVQPGGEPMQDQESLRIRFVSPMLDELLFLERLAQHYGYPGLPSKDPRLPGVSYVLGAREAVSGPLREFLGASPDTRVFDGLSCRRIAEDFYGAPRLTNITPNQRHMRDRWRMAFDEAGQFGSVTVS